MCCGLVSAQVMSQSDNQIVSQCFCREEVVDQKRPEMVSPHPHPYPCPAFHSSILLVYNRVMPDPQAATQFKNSLMKLMEILMSKEPSYVRCIKPNEAKQPGTSLEMKNLSEK